MRAAATALILAAAAFCVAVDASARKLDVVTTSSTGAMLVREVTGGHARVTVLGPPDRDLHYLQARPSMMRALRSADLLVAVGADLEIGWLPVALRQCANPAILPGRRGYFEFAAHVELVDIGGVADRSLGDVHPLGNPHVHMDPVRVQVLVEALAERLAELDPHHASHFYDHAQAFVASIDRALPDWQQQVEAAPGAVLFHQDANYLFYRFGVPVLGFLEPVPGIPPTGTHIKLLTDQLKGMPGVILHTTFQPDQAPKALGNALGWPVQRLSLEPPIDSTGEDYIAHIDAWIGALTSGRK
jgi:zinc/manganese transport system substrate-binding protein